MQALFPPSLDRLRWFLVTTVVLLALAVCGNSQAAEIHLLSPANTTSPAECEVVSWGQSERGSVVAHIRPPGKGTVPAGDYGIRITGTDYVYGPISLNKNGRKVVDLPTLRIASTEDAQSTHYFLLDRNSGSMAARVATGNAPTIVLPGQFDLQRDFGESKQPFELKTGDARELACGALRIDSPTSVSDFAYFIVDEKKSTIAAYASHRQGPQALLPGKYRIVREGSGIYSAPLEIRAGKTTALSWTSLKVTPLGAARPECIVYTEGDFKPVLRLPAGDTAALLTPGNYRIAPSASIAEPSPEILQSAVPLVASAGNHLDIWVTNDATILSPVDSQIPIRVHSLPGGYLSLIEPFRIEADIAEPCDLSVYVSSAEHTVTSKNAKNAHPNPLATLPAIPGDAQPSIRLPSGIPDGSLVMIYVEAKNASGNVFHGFSRPFTAAKPRVGKITSLTINGQTPTTVNLSWTAPEGESPSGYNIYREPLGDRPLNLDRPRAETSFENLGLTAGKTYQYSVAAIDGRGIEGPRSDTIKVTTPR